MKMVFLYYLHAGAYSAQNNNEHHPKRLSICDAIGMDGHKQHMFLLADPVISPSNRNTGMERRIRLEKPFVFPL